MDIQSAAFQMTLSLYLDAAPWLMVGIIAAGLVHAWMPPNFFAKRLGGRGVAPVIKAALIGAPLPLCSCGVLPTAIGLRRDGASKGATVSFLIATPETGPGSVAISYALLGPFMAVVRPMAALFSAIISGLLTNALVKAEHSQNEPASTNLNPSTCEDSDCSVDINPVSGHWMKRSWTGLHYAFFDLLDDLALWLVLGLVISGAMMTVVPPQAWAMYGNGPGAMVAMIIVGVPVYMCATASTPIAVGLLATGLSPGAVLVFLLVGPATNISTLGLVGKVLGARALFGYLLGLCGTALIAGVVVNAILTALDIQVLGQMSVTSEIVPYGMKWLSGMVLGLFLLNSLLKKAKNSL